jgi:HlyD family secretion protein
MKKFLIGTAIIAILVLLAGVILPHREHQSEFETVKVKRGELVSTVSATGTLAAVVTVQVGTNVSGTIQKLLVDFNSPVKAGQEIAQIDPSLYKAKVKETNGNYFNAISNLDRAREDLADAKRTEERSRNLFREGVISQADLDTAETKFKLATAAVKGAEWSVSQNQGLYDQAKTNLDYATIKSPINGVVISRNVDVGQTVAASFQTPTLFTIAQDLTKMEIQTSVDEADISSIRLGQRVSFTVDAYSDQTFKGAVSQIRKAPIMSQNVVTYIVIVSVENKDLKLMPGMTANATIETIRKQSILKVPNAALRFNPEPDDETKGTATDTVKKDATENVFVLREKRPVRIQVKTGLNADGYVEILSEGDLKENDDVIIERKTVKKKAVSGSSSPASPKGPGF